MKTINHLSLGLLATVAALMCAPQAKADFGFDVIYDTTAIMADSSNTYSVYLSLTGGSMVGNTAMTVGGFNFFGGSATGSANLNHSTGSLSTNVALSTSPSQQASSFY